MSAGLNMLFGSKPVVGPLASLDLGTEQQKSVTNNQNVAPAAQSLVNQSNLFTQGQITQMLNNAMPGFSAAAAKSQSNIDSWLKGEIPDDVASAVTRSSAAKSLGGGYAGSGMHGDLTARDLGLTSLDLMGKGVSAEQSWMSTMDKIYSPGMMNLSSMFVTPEQQASFDINERNSQFNRNWMQAQIDAMPEPVAVGMFNMATKALSSVVGSLPTSSFSGGGMDGAAAAGAAMGGSGDPGGELAMSGGGGGGEE